jgi:carbamoyl-phosphate synthase large subunit
VKTVFKVNEGRPNAVDLLKAGSLKLVIYTTTGGHTSSDEKRSAARGCVSHSLHHHDQRSEGRGGSHRFAARDPIRVWSCRKFTAGPRWNPCTAWNSFR